MIDFHLQVEASSFSSALSGSYDLTIGVVGYEQRASFCPLKLSKNTTNSLALRYTNRIEKDFELNNKKFEEAGFIICDLDDPTREADTTESIILRHLPNAVDRVPRVAVDVSSMSRKTIAGVFAALMGYAGSEIEVVFCYANAAFEPPPKKYPAAVVLNTVSSVFGGAPRGADKPTALILGLGVEQGRALAAYNQLEAQAVWAFFSTGNDTRYEEHISKANRALLSMSKITTLRYDINDPFLLYLKLRALVEGIRSDYRVVIVPLGAKVFALSTFLAAMELFPDLSIWRMSAGDQEPSFYRAPTGEGSAVRVKVSKRNDPINSSFQNS